MHFTASIRRPEPVFLGFIFKRIARRPGHWNLPAEDRTSASPVEMICSVSDCISPTPASMYERWAFNDARCYARDEPELASIPPLVAKDFTPLALEFFPLVFELGATHHAPAAEFFCIDPAHPPQFPPRHALPGTFGFLGYDVVSCRAAIPAHGNGAPTMAGFDHSPLSCNEEARRFAVNRYCLIEKWDTAVAAAEALSRDEPEPGPYVIIALNGVEPITAHAPDASPRASAHHA